MSILCQAESRPAYRHAVWQDIGNGGAKTAGGDCEVKGELTVLGVLNAEVVAK